MRTAMRPKDFDINAENLPFEFPVICQPKRNGLQGPWSTEHAELFTRNGHMITGLPHIREAILSRGYGNLPLDGELYTTALTFPEINGLVRRKKPTAKSPLIQLHVFDIAVDDIEMDERLAMMDELKECSVLKIMPYSYAANRNELLAINARYLARGEEGMVIRTPDGFYEEDKNHDEMWRLIPVQEMEAILVGLNPATTARNADTFGSMRLRLPSGVEFNCSGMSDKQREEIFEKKPFGQPMTIQYKRLQPSGKPVSPQYKDRRWDI